MRAPFLDRGWRRAIGLTVALWLFVGLLYLPVLVERHPHDRWTSIALDFSTVFVSIAIAMPLHALFLGVKHVEPTRRWLPIGAGVLAAAVANTVFDVVFTSWAAANFASSFASNLGRFYAALFNYFCVYGVNMALFHLAAARLRAEQQRRDLALALSTAQAAQLAALRFQLNPHFLFNTLNAISSMIVTGRNAEAEMMTSKLSAFLRTSLGADPQAPVTLGEELALVDDYLEIESVRFGERLRIVYDCSEAAERAEVPGFLLQPLVENAIKHGVSRSRQPVTVTIAAGIDDGRLSLSVRDDARAEADAPGVAGTGTGLANIRRRLVALYGDAARMTAGPASPGFRVEIVLPAAG